MNEGFSKWRHEPIKPEIKCNFSLKIFFFFLIQGIKFLHFILQNRKIKQMLQIGHNRMVFSLHMDDFLHHALHGAMFHCDTKCRFLWLWSLQMSATQGNSSLIFDDFVKKDLFLPKEKRPLPKLFPTNQKAYGFFTYFCCIVSYFSAEVCHSFLFGDYVSAHIPLPSDLSLFQFNCHPLDAQYLHASLSVLVVGTHGHRKLQDLGFCPEQSN